MTSESPALVSVVLPAYNAAPYLPTTLRSITDQSYRDLEVIVIDDGSTDSTAAVVEAFAENDHRVRLVRQDRNRGRSAARNRGIDEARGVWVCPTDADDLWARQRLAEFMRAAAEFPETQVMTDDRLGFAVDAHGAVSLLHRFVSRSTWRSGRSHRIDVPNWYLDQQCTMTPMIRRDFLDRSGARYPESMSAGEDLAFNLEVVFSKIPSCPVRVGLPNYYYRFGESSRASNMAESQVRMIRHALERTGSAELAALARRAEPGWVFIFQRADRLYAEAGRAAARDAGVDEIELVGDRGAGYRRLALVKALEMLGRWSDRKLRPALVADITAQLSS